LFTPEEKYHGKGFNDKAVNVKGEKVLTAV
jgi:hypothetical protein